MVSTELQKWLTCMMIFAALILVVSPTLGSTALAQGEPSYARQVRAIEISDIGMPQPAGGGQDKIPDEEVEG
jgi:hypothetical protein